MSTSYATAWRHLRIVRGLFIGLWLCFLPSMYVLSRLEYRVISNVVVTVLFGVYFIVAVGLAFVFGIWRCPGCGSMFNYGFPRGWQSPWPALVRRPASSARRRST